MSLPNLPTTPPGTVLAAAGSANRIVLATPGLEAQGNITLSGAYSGMQLVAQASYDGLNFFDVGPLIRSDTLLPDGNAILQPDGLTLAYAVKDGTCQSWIVPIPPDAAYFSVYAANLSAGPVGVRMSAGTFFASPPGSQAQTLGGIMLYQLLMQLVLSVQDLKGPSGGRAPSGYSADFTNNVVRLPQ